MKNFYKNFTNRAYNKQAHQELRRDVLLYVYGGRHWEEVQAFHIMRGDQPAIPRYGFDFGPRINVFTRMSMG